jgi:hypothetical protein
MQEDGPDIVGCILEERRWGFGVRLRFEREPPREEITVA